MTRKDYVLIAKAITNARYYDASPLYALGINRAVIELAVVLKAENPRFDEAKFLSACQIGKLPRLSEVA